MNPQLSRRALLKGSLGLAVAAASSLRGAPALAQTVPAPAIVLPALPGGDALTVARNEAYWAQIAALYRQSPDFVNLEHGFYGIMPRPVLVELQRNIERLNERNSYFLRQEFSRETDAVRGRIAALLGVQADEIALTRGATEALQNLITNYRGLKPGDTVMYADLDYDSAQSVFDYLPERRGVKVARIVLPEPATEAGILDAYAKGLAANPGTRLLLLTHINHKTGLILPVAEITRLAKARGVDVILDAAHSWGHIDFRLPELGGVDFAAFNLHKWVGAPLGVGFLYIRKSRLDDIAPHLSAAGEGAGDIRARVHSGTTATANVMTVPTALDFQAAIGVPNKEARLRYLRDYWVERVRDVKGVQILTPDVPRLHGAISALRIGGRSSLADSQALARRLREQYGIFTVARGGLASGAVVRITPAIFTRPADLDRLVSAVREIARG